MTRAAAVVKTTAGTFSGSATWHEPAEPGEEPRGVAYPAVDPAAGCAEATLTMPCPAELPYLAVGSMLSVRNECTGAARVLPVTGCGAAARLFYDRCLTCGTSPRGRVADLTLISFAELARLGYAEPGQPGQPRRHVAGTVLVVPGLPRKGRHG